MISLKAYQARVLDSLSTFLRSAGKGTPVSTAFRDVVAANGREPEPYLTVRADGFSSEMPFVCLRVPTGGGKTLLACHAAGIAIEEYLQADSGVVLWLVPSTTILTQTADALRDPNHPYRLALNTACGGPVEVVTIEEALQLPAAAAKDQTVVIVSTIQAFRAEDTTGRKVYGQNGVFSEHLLNLPAGREGDLLPGPDGKPLPSLVNFLRLRRPVVIVDEAHNSRTPLSFAMLASVLPSCIIEFTATPDRNKSPSNLLHYVSASELKAADMVKLPVRVIVRDPSQRDELVADAITLRSDLERLAGAEAQATGEYLRPILLIQAERIDACEPLREQLIANNGIPKEQILISTGTKDELKGAPDVSSPKSPVRIIITVEKLREGWDCPFAYVLCSLKLTRSATAIEQIVGRILRLPGAKPKQHPDLNCAYAFSLSQGIGEVLAELRDALVSNGFTQTEAERIVIPVTQSPLGAQPRTVTLEPGTELDVNRAATEATSLAGKIKVDSTTGAVTILVPLDEAEAERIESCAKTAEARDRITRAVNVVREIDRAFSSSPRKHDPSPYERQMDFIVPLLAAVESGDSFEFERSILLEHPWKLSERDATLPENYNPRLRPKGRTGTVDIGRSGDVKASVAAESDAPDFVSTLHQSTLTLGGTADWSMEALIRWLDHRIDHTDIPSGESAAFLRKVITGLMAKFEITEVSVLALDRFRLRDQIETRIQQHRATEQGQAFQQWLTPDSSLSVTPEFSINFRTMDYEPVQLYDGAFEFKKHYFGVKPGDLKERRADGGLTEEFQCAQYLDGLTEVRFWIRNLSRKRTSFRLQTSTDWFYPDFVCQLTDGRILVVEYKGKHLVADSADKAAVGAVWANRSGGRCLFALPSNLNFTAISEAIQRSDSR